MNDPPTSATSPEQRPTPPPAPKEQRTQTWRSEELLGAECEALILHNEEIYRLRRTRQGKLILYK
jgi:hemin uptake protein HemP